MADFTPVQRERIIRDIINHKADAATHTETEMSQADIEEELDRMRRVCSDDDLKNMWETRVGEWLCSIGSEYPGFSEKWADVRQRGRYDNPADWQFDKLLEDGDIDYTYTEYVYEPPYMNVEPPVDEPLHIVNYPDIRESLERILDREAPDAKDRVLDSLDDALGNNADHLVLSDER